MAGWWTAFDKKLDSIVEFVEQQQSGEPLNELKDMLYQCTANMAEMKAKQENMIVDMDKVWTDMKNVHILRQPQPAGCINKQTADFRAETRHTAKQKRSVAV